MKHASLFILLLTGYPLLATPVPSSADSLSFAMNMLRKSETIVTAHIGLIGYSWGRPAALILAENASVAAVLSLDGSELHYYGQAGEEDSSALRALRRQP